MFKFKKMIKINQIKNNDSILILSAVLLLILSGFLVFRFSPGQTLPSSRAPKIIGEASLIVDFGNSEKRVFRGDIVENENLLNVLSQAAKAGGLSYKLDGKNNLAIVSLRDISQREKNFTANKIKMWQWSVNGKRVERPLYEIIVRPNDEILIKYAQ